MFTDKQNISFSAIGLQPRLVPSLYSSKFSRRLPHTSPLTGWKVWIPSCWAAWILFVPSSIMLQINRRFVSYYMLSLRISVTSDFVRFR